MEMCMRVLVTGAFQMSEEERKLLEQISCEITFHQWEKDEVENPEAYEVVICNGLFLYNDIRKFTNLKMIQLTSAGLDRVPVDYIQEKGIVLKNAGETYAVPMAEWTIMRILEVYKNARFFHETEKQHQWIKQRNIRELCGKTACILGTGAVGKEIAKRLKVFGVQVTGVNRTGHLTEEFDTCKSIREWMDVIPTSDIVIAAIPHTKDTEKLIDAQWFEVMKKDAVFVNVARGQIVDEQALLEVVQSKKIDAVLDVFQTEPLGEEHPFWKLDNVWVSPHNSFVGEGNHGRLFRIIIQNMIKILDEW